MQFRVYDKKNKKLGIVEAESLDKVNKIADKKFPKWEEIRIIKKD